jgi:hypothetical protein
VERVTKIEISYTGFMQTGTRLIATEQLDIGHQEQIHPPLSEPATSVLTDGTHLDRKEGSYD